MTISTLFNVLGLIGFVLHFIWPKRFPPVSGLGGASDSVSVSASTPEVAKRTPAAGDAGQL